MPLDQSYETLESIARSAHFPMPMPMPMPLPVPLPTSAASFKHVRPALPAGFPPGNIGSYWENNHG